MTREQRAFVLPLLMLLAITLMSRVITGTVHAPSADEVVYGWRARAALDRGLFNSRESLRAYLADSRQWPYPPPTRVGYLLFLALTMKLTGLGGERAGALLSHAASLATMLLTCWIGYRFLGLWSGILGALFFVLFPANLVVSVRCWPDALIGLVGLGMFYLTLELLANFMRRDRLYLLLAGLGASAFLIKETALLLYAICFGALLLESLIYRNWQEFRRVLAFAALGALLTVVCLAAFTGGDLFSCFRVFLVAAAQNGRNPYALNQMSGPGYLLLVGLASLSGAAAVLAVAGIVLSLIRWRHCREAAYLAGMVCALFGIFMSVPHWLNLRYVSPAYGPICLFAAWTLYQLWVGADRMCLCPQFRVITVLAGVLATAFMIHDLLQAERHFIGGPGTDLSIRQVLAGHGCWDAAKYSIIDFRYKPDAVRAQEEVTSRPIPPPARSFYRNLQRLSYAAVSPVDARKANGSTAVHTARTRRVGLPEPFPKRISF